MVYLSFSIDPGDTITPTIHVFPPHRDIVTVRSEGHLRVVIDYHYTPFTGEFVPLMIDLLPPPKGGFEVIDVQLSTPPGIEIPVAGFGTR